MTDSDNIFKWLAAHRLIKNLLHCVRCNEEYSLNVYNEEVDGSDGIASYIIFCPTDYVTILFHVFCQYTTFKIALIIYTSII